MKTKVTFLIVLTYCLFITSCSDMLSEYVRDSITAFIGDVRITNETHSSQWPVIIWIGTEYGASWYDSHDGNSEIYFARLYPDGTKK
jgi:hypothetical protein